MTRCLTVLCWSLFALRGLAQPGPLPVLPPLGGRPNPGVAGAYAGVSHGTLLVAGGANFPDAPPWRGGRKVWHATAYALVRRGDHPAWQVASPLAQPRAYGASATWRNRLIGVGGSDSARRLADAFTLEWDSASGTLRQGALPALPRPLASASAAVLGDALYVLGGESDQGAEKSLLRLDLTAPGTCWQPLPDLPGPRRAYSALVALGTSLYVLGGRQTVGRETRIFSDAYEFRLSEKTWHRLPDLPRPLSAHAALAVGPHRLLVVGGDDGQRLRRIEALTNAAARLPDGRKKRALLRHRNELQARHPGFRREVLLFDPRRRTWSVRKRLPSPVPVTTPALAWDGRVVLPSGEVSPGVRTPGLLVFNP